MLERDLGPRLETTSEEAAPSRQPRIPGAVFAARVLFLVGLCAPWAFSAPGSEWTAWESAESRLILRVPASCRVEERGYDYVRGTQPRSVRVLRVLIPSPANGSRVVLEVYAEALPAGLRFEDWVLEDLALRHGSLVETGSTLVGGRKAIVRTGPASERGGAVGSHLFLEVKDHAYHFFVESGEASPLAFDILQALSFDTGGAARGPVAHTEATPGGEPFVRPARALYMSPLDKTQRLDYSTVVQRAMQHVQGWYRAQLDGSASFATYVPLVTTSVTPHDAAWYQTNPSTGDSRLWFVTNVLTDAAVAGVVIDPVRRDWALYIDADPACGQLGGSGSPGQAILVANDLRGLLGEPDQPPCPTDFPDLNGPCRWVGGLAHELGHTLGLPHPPSCQDPSPTTTCPSGTLMWLGYITYPNTYLLDSDKAILRANPVLTGLAQTPAPFSCESLLP